MYEKMVSVSPVTRNCGCVPYVSRHTCSVRAMLALRIWATDSCGQKVWGFRLKNQGLKKNNKNKRDKGKAALEPLAIKNCGRVSLDVLARLLRAGDAGAQDLGCKYLPRGSLELQGSKKRREK
jgi:hypothetical protein